MLHSKGMYLGALRILLRCLSDANQPFDMYVTVQTHQLTMTYSCGIISDWNLRGHQSQARCGCTPDEARILCYIECRIVA
jgi:hypothetical protein